MKNRGSINAEKPFLGTLLVLLLFATTGYAQAGGSTVRGTIKDPQGNTVAGATVNLTNAQEDIRRGS